MSYAGHNNPLCGSVAAEFICDDHAWSAPGGRSQQLAEESNSGKSIALGLHEDVKDYAILINRSPQIVSHSVDLEEDFVQMPFVTGPSAASSQTAGIRFAKLVAPAADRFIAEQYSPSRH